MGVPQRWKPPTYDPSSGASRTEALTYCGRRFTYAAGGFTAPGWPGTIEADEGLFTLQPVA